MNRASCTFLVFALAVFAAAGLFAIERTWIGGDSTDWTEGANFDPAGVPETNDVVVISTNVTLKLLSTDTNSWNVANSLDYIKPLSSTSLFEVTVPSGEDASLLCGVSYVPKNDWHNFDKGAIVKKGEGVLRLTKGGGSHYYTSLFVREGTLVCPDNITSAGANNYYDKVDVSSGACLYLPHCAPGVGTCPCVIRGLTGSGTITNESTYSWGNQLIIDAQKTNEFSGVIGGSIRPYVRSRTTLSGTGNAITGAYCYASYNQGLGKDGPMLSFVKMGNLGEPSSIGMIPICFEDYNTTKNAEGYLRYLGTGETSNKDIYFNKTTDYASYFDAGAHGGLTLTGTIKPGSGAAQNYTFVLTGDNETECKIAGSVEDSGSYAITNIIKQGSGAWRFSDVDRTWSGALTVESGTLRYDSLAPAGTACALGTAGNAAPYPILLKGGVFEYSGDSRLEVSGRTVAVDGTATIRNASGHDLRIEGVTGVSAGSRVVLDGDGDVTNVLSGVTGPVSICKTGGSTWKLNGEQSFSGDVAVSNGVLLVTRPKYEYYRLWFRHTISNALTFFVSEIGLYSADGKRQNRLMDYVGVLDNAAALAPNQASVNRAFTLTGSTSAATNMFEDATRDFKAYLPRTGDNPTYLDPEDESTWFCVLMRLKDGAEPVTSYDIVVGGSKMGSDPANCSVDSYKLEGSVDGRSWDVLNVTNGYSQAYVSYQWFFGSEGERTGSWWFPASGKDNAETHTNGKTIDSRPSTMPTLLDDAGYISVAPNATIRAVDDDIEISKVRVSASGSGTIDNFRIAENGGGCALDVVGFDGGKGGLTIPGVFANLSETDVSRLAGWSLAVNGTATSRFKMKVSADGSVSISPVGMTILVR